MKINKFHLFAMFLFLSLAACKKDDNNPAPPASDTYMNTASGSTWNYHLVDNSTGTSISEDYVITSTDRDTTINSKTYHVFTTTFGGNQYRALLGNEYYQYDSLPGGIGGGAIERLYLKDNVAAGATWSQSITVNVPGSPIPIPFTITNTLAEKDISRTVNGTVYDQVIHVSTAITSTLIPAASLTTSINSYFAPKYGLIENSNIVHLDFLGIVQDLVTETKLTAASLK